jgi:hypothetical protein
MDDYPWFQPVKVTAFTIGHTANTSRVRIANVDTHRIAIVIGESTDGTEPTNLHVAPTSAITTGTGTLGWLLKKGNPPLQFEQAFYGNLVQDEWWCVNTDGVNDGFVSVAEILLRDWPQ